MPIALDPIRTHRYTLQAERSHATPTVFLIRALTVRQRAEVADLVTASSGGDFAPNLAQQRMRRVEFGLVGWEALCTADGSEVEFVAHRVHGGAAEASLNRLPDDAIVELSEAIAELSDLPRAARD
jgi:hypothetical protein